MVNTLLSIKLYDDKVVCFMLHRIVLVSKSFTYLDILLVDRTFNDYIISHFCCKDMAN